MPDDTTAPVTAEGLRERMVEAMRAHHVVDERTDWSCVCGQDPFEDWNEHLAEVAASLRWEHATHLAAENAQLRAKVAGHKAAFERAWEVHAGICSEPENVRLRAELAEVKADLDQVSVHKGVNCYWRSRARAAEAGRTALKSAVKRVLSDPIMHSPLGKPLVRVEDLLAALDAPGDDS